MSQIYEDYYREITDGNGRICGINTQWGPHFNFAYDVIDRFAKESPDKPALLHLSALGEVTRFTFADMKRLSDKAANALRALGIKKGMPVFLLLKRRYEFWISILALHKLGAIAVPTSHMVSAEDIRERTQASGAKAVICVNSEHICEKVAEAVSGNFDPDLDARKKQRVLALLASVVIQSRRESPVSRQAVCARLA